MKKVTFAKDVDGNLFIKSAERIGLRKLPFMDDTEMQDFRNEVFRLSDWSQIKKLEDQIDGKETEDYTSDDWEISDKIALLESEFNHPTFDGGLIDELVKLVMIGFNWFSVKTSVPVGFTDVYESAVKYQNDWLKADSQTVKIQEENLKTLKDDFISYFRSIEKVPEDFNFSVSTWIVKQFAAFMFKTKSTTTGGKGLKTAAQKTEVVTLEEAYRLYCSAVLQALGYGTFPKNKKIYG